MNLKGILALNFCKFARFGIRMLGRGGTDMPGRLALKLCPDLPAQVAGRMKIIIVTGTNGKTTTCRMLEHCLEKAGLPCVANRSGANLIGGITTELCANATFSGRPKRKYAVLECDEAAFRRVGLLTDPAVVVVTNIFRDQLDRFGEISHTRGSIITGLKNSPHATVCINADCSLSVSMLDELENDAVFFGAEGELFGHRVEEVSDALYCIRCKGKYEYDFHTFGHLGGFRCPKCGFARPNPDVAVVKVLEDGLDSISVRMRVGENEYVAPINLPGAYNVYNAAASVAACRVLGIADETALAALADFEGGFGRMEAFSLGNSTMRMILVKNPAGCNQTLNYLRNLEQESVFALALNDRAGDGTDISWIWDADFEKLTESPVKKVFVSGIRAEDMAVRLKYAGISDVAVIHDYQELLNTLAKEESPVYIMPTYSAMLDIRGVIAKHWGCKNFWE